VYSPSGNFPVNLGGRPADAITAGEVGELLLSIAGGEGVVEGGDTPLAPPERGLPDDNV